MKARTEKPCEEGDMLRNTSAALRTWVCSVCPLSFEHLGSGLLYFKKSSAPDLCGCGFILLYHQETAGPSIWERY